MCQRRPCVRIKSAFGVGSRGRLRRKAEAPFKEESIRPRRRHVCEEGIHFGGYLEENTKFLARIFQAGLRLFHLTVQVIL